MKTGLVESDGGMTRILSEWFSVVHFLADHPRNPTEVADYLVEVCKTIKGNRAGDTDVRYEDFRALFAAVARKTLELLEEPL